MKKLLKWDFNWADEVDVTGYSILTEEEFKNFKDLVTDKEVINRIIDREIYYGTNEFITIEEEDLLNIVSDAIDISDDHAEIIERYIGLSEGMVNIPTWLEYYRNRE